MAMWQLQQAKAKFSQLIQDSGREPQFISKHGVEVSVVINIEKYRELIEGANDLVAFFNNSPLKGMGEEMDLTRDPSKMRDLDL